MNDDTEELEQSLRRWQPREVPFGLAHHIGQALEPRPTPASRWWERLGFSHPLAAFGWGLAAPAMIVLLTIQLATGSSSIPAEPTPSIATSTPPPAPAWKALAATNRRFEANDEGVVLDDAQRPMRRTRYRSEDTLEWRDSHTGTGLQVSYPREDIVLTPVVIR